MVIETYKPVLLPSYTAAAYCGIKPLRYGSSAWYFKV